MIATLSGNNLPPEDDDDLWLQWQITLTKLEARTYLRLCRAVGAGSIDLRVLASELGTSITRLKNEVLPSLERYGFIRLPD